MAAGTGPAVITRELFAQHGRACRVYNYEEEYEKVNAAALARDPPVEIKEELKDRGYRDFSSFYMDCPKFSLFCWPSELRDLGGGVVLYFHFLVFCGGFLFLAFLVQIPVVYEYMSAGNIDAWNWDVGGFHTADTENCKCLGRNGDREGLAGPSEGFRMQGYGTSCGAWDLSWCQQGSGGPFAEEERGLWCCRSWCYTSPKCPSSSLAGSPSLSNRFAEDADLVRSYSSCAQPAPSACGASSGMDRDVPYPKDAFRESPDVPEGLLRITGPGNLGPDRGESSVVGPCYLALLLLFSVAVVVAHQYQQRAMHLVDQGTTHPNDFAIFAQGLPTTATDEAQIAQFFRAHAVAGRDDVEIVKVVIGWNSEKYRRYKRRMMALKLRLVWATATESYRCLSCLSCGRSVEDVIEELKELQESIRLDTPDTAKALRSSGTVVVVFRHQRDARLCLERWTTIPARLFNREASGCFGLGLGDPLPRFGNWPLRVERAPNPSDINWEDLGVSPREKLTLFARTNGCVLLLIAASFFLVYGLEKLKDYMRGGGIQWSILPVLGISLTNMLLMSACKYFGKLEYHNTLAEQTASQSLKMAVALVMNTTGVMFFKSAQPKEWYTSLVDDIFLLMAVTATIQPLVFLLDPKYYLVGHWRRRALTDEKLEEWNGILREVPKTPDDVVTMRKQKAQIQKQVEKLKEAFQPSELETTKRYAVAVRTFVCALLYSPLMPLLSLVGILGLVIQYWVDKYMLLRWFKRPKEPHPVDQAVICLLFIRYVAAIFLPIAVYVFIHPSWKQPDDLFTWLLLSLAVAAGCCAVPLSVARTLLGLRCLPGMRKTAKVMDAGDAAEALDYFKAQRLWTKEMKYHKSQFLYKMVPEAKNPEMLSPGAYAATSAADVQGSYGAAAEAMTSSASEPSGLHVRGHGKVGLEAYGAFAVPSTKAEPAFVKEAPTAVDPVVVIQEAGDATDVSPATGVFAAKRPEWQYDTGKRFKRFDDDCQAYIEKKYQEKLAGGAGRVTVQTQGFSVSIDFEKMTQKVSKRGQIRKVRREEG